MTRVKRAAQWLDVTSEVISDRLNPILVKETRQALKSRQFVATFLLMLTASWLISIFGAMLAHAQIQYGESGEGFFIAYYAVLAVAILVIVPFGAFRSLLNERDLDTSELLQITTLSPRRIIWGKLMSAVVQLMIYYSAIAPFIAFTALLRGFDLATAAVVLVLSFLYSIFASMVALMLSTLVRQRHTQSLLSLILLAGLAMSFFSALSMVGSAIAFELPINSRDFWIPMGLMSIYGILGFVLCLQIATAQLTFESDNRSTGIRLTCTAVFGYTWLWVGAAILSALFLPGSWFGMSGSRSGLGGVVATTTAFTAFGLMAVGLFAVTEDEHLSRRVRRELPVRSFWRLFRIPFLPGGGRGLIYLMGHTAVLWAFAVGLLLILGADRTHFAFVTSVCCYLLIYLGVGAFLGRWIRELAADVRAAHARVLVVFLGIGGSLFPHLALLFDSRPRYPRQSLFQLSDPFSTLSAILEGNNSRWAVGLLLFATVASLALNVKTMLAGIGEVMNAEPRKGTTPAAKEVAAESAADAADEPEMRRTFVPEAESRPASSAAVPQE